MFVIAAQACFLYGSAGPYKVQGGSGATAPPSTTYNVLIAVACYLTVLLGMHLGIAALMGLPLFSGAMIIADAAFLPDRFYRSLGRLRQRTGRWTHARETGAPAREGRALVPPQSAPVSRGSSAG
jgi:hypothetical protein